ncbi:hypothetical protein MKX01_028135 [Papaver californicum]|nr:hypothetical protein MKX01_028135 [Papaver californicum]
MASLSSSSVCILAFLLLSIFLVSASPDDEKNVAASILPSLGIGSLTEFLLHRVGADQCGQPGDSSSETTIPTTSCADCTNWCKEECADVDGDVVENKCAIGESKYMRRCKCCCREKPKPPPPPPSAGDQCGLPGDSSSETTIPTTNCADCTNWCKEECSDVGADMVDDKCAIGESKYMRRCKCCCREKPKPPSPPPSAGDQCRQQGDTPKEATMPTSNCADCTTWCKKQCSDIGSYVVDDKCAIPGQSGYLRRCNCCCRDNSKPPPSPSCPGGCPADVTWTLPGMKPCKYKLVT